MGLFVEEADTEIIGDIPAELTLVRDGVGAPGKGIYLGVRQENSPFRETFRVFPKALIMGAGCRKDLDPEVFSSTVRELMSENGLSMKAVSHLATIDIKKDEACMKMFCAEEGLEMITYYAEELMDEKGDFDHSDFVMRVTGADNVSERAAFRAARLLGEGKPEMILQRAAKNGVTLSVCEKKWECRFDV